MRDLPGVVALGCCKAQDSWAQKRSVELRKCEEKVWNIRFCSILITLTPVLLLSHRPIRSVRLPSPDMTVLKSCPLQSKVTRSQLS